MLISSVVIKVSLLAIKHLVMIFVKHSRTIRQCQVMTLENLVMQMINHPHQPSVLNLGQVSSQAVSSYVVFFMMMFIQMLYFEDWQVPCWRAELDDDVTLLVQESITYYESNMADITDMNELLITLLTNTGGEQYATLGSLVTRQITGAYHEHGLIYTISSQLYMKEISSDGDVSTVDVIYPSSPYFLWLHPEMLRDILIPIHAYGNNETTIDYNLAWAPHHL